jgi:predicted negative regulator of RcsB-dependent stress response
VVDVGSPARRATDQGVFARFRLWWSENAVQFIVLCLLAVIVAGELSDFFNDREQAARDQHQECVLGNAVEQSAESVRRLRAQSPVLDAARRLISAESQKEEAEAVADLKAEGVPRFSNADLAEPEDCEAP